MINACTIHCTCEFVCIRLYMHNVHVSWYIWYFTDVYNVLVISDFMHFLFYQLDSVETLRRISSSTFLSLTVSPDLMKLAIFTSTQYTLIVNLPNYCKNFPYHYPKAVHTKSSHRSSQSKVSVQASKAAIEEEDDMLKYGGISKRQRFHGTMYHGPFMGHYATQKNRMRLKEKVNNVNLQHGQGLNFDGTISMKDSMTNSKNNPDALLKWYEQGSMVERREDIYSNEQRRSSVGYDALFTSSFGRRGSVTPSNYSTNKVQLHSRKASYSVQSTDNWLSYPFNCILPPPDTPPVVSSSDVLESLTVDGSHFSKCSLLHMDCSNSRLIGYYCNEGYHQADCVITGLNLEQSISYITVYNLIEQSYLIVK